MKRFRVTILLLCLIILSGCNGVKTGKVGIEKNELHHGPAPNYLEFTALPEHQDYKSGESVRLNVSIKNVWKDPIQINNVPYVLIGSIMKPSDQYESIAISSFKNKTLKPQEELKEEIIWQLKGEPGWYQAELGEINIGGTRLSGNARRFFVENSVNRVLIKSIKSGISFKLPSDSGETTFIIKSIEMNEHHTQVYFDIKTNQAAPIGFHMTLSRSNGITDPGPALGLEQSEIKDGLISGSAVFNPTTVDVDQITIQINEWAVVHTGIGVETLKGPWNVNIPLT